MTQSPYLWSPPPVRSLAVRGADARAPVNRLFFVGRNYHAHAAEMGRPVDRSVDRPFYFTKSPQSLVESGASVAYPPETANYHHEMELVVVIGAPGFRVTAAERLQADLWLCVRPRHDAPRPAVRPAETRAGRGISPRTSKAPPSCRTSSPLVA